jgi:putative membrane protein
MRVTLAVLHLLALGVGFGAVFARARAANRLRQSADALRATFAADAWWGVAFLLWLTTGLWRWLGSIEKTASYYATNHIFLAKMGLLVVILALELWPMITLIRWRIASGKGTLDAAQLGAKGRLIARISDAQMLLLVGMVIAAVMMARGFGSAP